MKFVVLAAALVVTLSGCSATVAPSPSPTSTPSAKSTALAPQVLAGFSFDDGKKLSTSTSKAPVFANTFADANSGWTADESTDPSNGYWSYTSADGGCTATISQIQIGTNFSITKGDDSKTSDAALTWYFRNDSSIKSALSKLVTDAALPYGANWKSGDPGAEFRGFTAESDDGSVLAAYARAFSVPKIALFFDLTCMSTEAFEANSQSALLNSAVLTF